jgi:hypothetical protein
MGESMNVDQQLPQFINQVIDRLQTVEGIVAIMLGGSRARDTHTPKSDKDIAQVNQVIDECHSGQITIDYQPGHPLGFVSSIYMGEVALGLPLHDPNGVLAALKAKTTPYRQFDIQPRWRVPRHCRAAPAPTKR